MTAEWVDALGYFHPQKLHEAVAEHIRQSAFWPTIADLISILRQATPPPGLPRYRPETREFVRDGRTEVEEIAHRVAQTLKWKQRAREEYPEQPDPFEAKVEPKGASQEMTVSDELMQSCAVRRAKGLSTCERNCSGRNCALKKEDLQ